jgi:hypothetical protein
VQTIAYPFHFSLANLGPLVAVCALFAAGCAGEHVEVKLTEVKRIEEKLQPEEIETLLRIVDSFSDKKLPPLPDVFKAPPDWNASRTLTVGQLTAEEEQLLEERTSVEWMARQLPMDRALDVALRREQMTADQFVGLSLAVGMALARGTVDAPHNLKKIIARGEKELSALRDDDRSFAELSLDQMHEARTKAVWITRLDRAARLDRVPPENVALVEENRKRLEAVFPQEFLCDPLAEVADQLEEHGVPFEELPETGSDEHIEWSAAEVIRGPQSEIGSRPAASSAERNSETPN